MENLIIDNGTKEYIINGDENKKISFCPTDTNIISRYKETLPFFESLEKKYSDLQNETTREEDLFKKINDIKDISDEIKSKIDYIFNSKISEIVLNDTSCFSIAKNGKLVFQNLIESLINVVNSEISYTINKTKNSEKVKSYLNKYKNKKINNKYIKHYDNKKSN